MVQQIENIGPETVLVRKETLYDFLSTSFLYKSLPKNVLKKDLKKATPIFEIFRYSAGEVIFNQGSIGDSMIMIAEGVVSFVQKKADGQEKVLRKLGKYEVIGENCFVHDNHKLLSSVVAFENVVTVLKLDREVYLREENKSYMQPIKSRVEAASRVMIRNGIRKVPFMQGLGPEDFKAFTLKTVGAGFKLTEEKEIGDKFFILLSGSVVVTVMDDLGLYVEIARMDPAESPVSFGERALVTEEPRNATITTLEKTSFFEIGKSQFTAIMQKNEAVKNGVSSIIQRAHLGNYFVNNIPIFHSMSLNNQRLLGVVAAFKTFEPKEYVKKEGELKAKSFYLIIQGQCEIYVGGERVNTLGVGDYFGEVGLVTNRASSASVRVSPDGTLSCMAISSEDFNKILASEPAFLAQMRIRVEGTQCSLEDLLQHPEGRASFLEYCKLEYAKENVNFWQDVLDLENINMRRIRKSILKALDVDPKGIKKKKERMLRSRANNIYKKYLAEGAPEEINLPGEIREALLKRYDDNKFSFDMFETAKQSIYGLIEADNFQRYKASATFEEFIKEIGTYKRATVEKLPFLPEE